MKFSKLKYHPKIIGSIVALVLLCSITTCLALSYIYHPGTAEYDVVEGTVNIYTTVTVSANPVEGQLITFTATLNPIRAGITVEFKVDGVSIGSDVTNNLGIATKTTMATMGHHTVEAIPIA